MSLETVPDFFDDTAHQELDRMVNKAAESDALVMPNLGFLLLYHIVVHSNGDLDPKYLDNKQARLLINRYGALQDMLSSAWARKSYREIRNLGPCPPSPSNIY